MICLLLTIAVILGFTAWLVAAVFHNPRAGEGLRDAGITALVVACLMWFLDGF
jgi:hypothetical protein